MNNMDSIVIEPETYFLKPNKHAPNNDLPILIYRDVLPLPLSEERTKGFLESHAWIRGGTWGHINIRHFHPNTHECYGKSVIRQFSEVMGLDNHIDHNSASQGIFQGESTLLLGCGTNDNDGGQELEVRAGDVIVLPAGTAHCSVQSSKDYEYIGVYPAVTPILLACLSHH
jgi:uncharacterized protein YjlB